MVLSTTGWHVCWARSGHIWGSAGHGYHNCSTGAVIEAAQPWVEAATFSFQEQTSKKIGTSRSKPKILSQFFQTNLQLTFFFYFGHLAQVLAI